MFFKIQNLIKIMTKLTRNAGLKVVSKNFLACEQCKSILIRNVRQNRPNSEVKVEEFDMKISQKGKGTS